MGLRMRDLIGLDAIEAALAAAAARVEHDTLIAGSHTEHVASTLVHPHLPVEDMSGAANRTVTDDDTLDAVMERVASPTVLRWTDTIKRRAAIAQDRGDRLAVTVTFFPWVTVIR